VEWLHKKSSLYKRTHGNFFLRLMREYLMLRTEADGRDAVGAGVTSTDTLRGVRARRSRFVCAVAEADRGYHKL
jgi:hypothetical protein